MAFFVKAVNEKGGMAKGGTLGPMFEKWLAVITGKDIGDKEMIKNIRDEHAGMEGTPKGPRWTRPLFGLVNAWLCFVGSSYGKGAGYNVWTLPPGTLMSM
jgi:hypothetical protein